MQPVLWTQTADQRESLALALRAILAGRGVDQGYDQLVALLGLGFSITADPAGCAAHWQLLARDAALLDASEVCGMRLRDLHPPDAAIGLASSAEFPQHFADSYVPLIRRAVAHDQPVLAWRGWEVASSAVAAHGCGPPPHWGVVCEERPDGLYGLSFGGPPPRRLAGAAHQVYVLEEYDARLALLDQPSVLLAIAIRAALTFWSPRLAERHGVAAGEAAYRAWIAAVESGRLCPACRQNGAACAAESLAALLAARRQQAQWLRRIGLQVGNGLLRLAQRWAEVCERTVDVLQPLVAAAGLSAQCASAAGRSELGAALFETSGREAALLDELRGFR